MCLRSDQTRSEEHTSELQSPCNLVCRLLLEKKKQRAARNINVEMAERATIGQRIADKVASFGGSWTFIIIYLSFLVTWMAFTSFVLLHYVSGENGAQFDPYPYILLNLMLSMTAALQAPIIMMSQNRAAEKDRLAAEQDFKVNLKSELMLEEIVRN